MRSAGHVSSEFLAQSLPRPEDVSGSAEVDAVRPVFQDRHARGHHVLEQARKQALELLCSAGHEQVQMPVLWDRRTVCRCARQLVALVHRDLGIKVRKHPRGA